MSSKMPKAYQHLASLQAKAFDDGSNASIERRLQQLPTPGNDWAKKPPPEFPMPWASSWGQDEFGLWCGFTLGEVTQKMRWIPPGEFKMGSPSGEPDRGDDEMQHSVEITQGYWLADVACTQKLWQAVMSDNPSHFTGEHLPVEKISWDDAQTFCQRLNKKLPEFEARLPSEAEWEYACRAGTETAFWWGNELSVDLANYDGGHPYKDGPEGEYREMTMPVNSFTPNPWGLFQVHGNVREWCEDWYGKYPEKEALDPQGAQAGESRVLRGGSWYNLGLWLRSAYRVSIQPGFRYYYTGFRLAAGPRRGGAR